MVTAANLESRVQAGQMADQVRWDHQGSQDLKEFKDHRVYLAREDPQGRMELLEQQAHEALLVIRDLPVSLVHLASVVLRVKQVPEDRKVHLDLPDLRAQ